MDGEQPRCTKCGTVLRDDLDCRSCGLVYLEVDGELFAIVDPWSTPAAAR